MLELGYSYEAMTPIMGRIAGNASSGLDAKDTWTTGEELMTEWIGPSSYVPGWLESVLMG